jgi:DNA-binding LacI/PurR family transcriptional regulator
VSKVLNGRRDVAPATRRKVESALDSAGYVRRLRASGSRRPRFVTFVVDEIDRPECGALLRGVASATSVLGMDVLVCEELVDPQRGILREDAVEKLRTDRTAGAILAFTDVSAEQQEQLLDCGITCVVIAPESSRPPGLAVVTAHYQAGAFAATQHLTVEGHRRIALLDEESRGARAEALRAGYAAALGAAGLDVDERLVLPSAPQGPGGPDGILQLLDGPEPPTAAFACSDLLVPGVYKALAGRGLRVPRDFSIVGFGDLAHAQWITPALTTVREPLVEMGVEAVRALFQPGGVRRARRSHTTLSTRLVQRESTAPMAG